MVLKKLGGAKAAKQGKAIGRPSNVKYEGVVLMATFGEKTRKGASVASFSPLPRLLASHPPC